MTDPVQETWGRVDETGTVFVRTSEGERAVGQYPDGSAQEALAFFERKYADLAGQVGLLEQRVRRGAPVVDIAKTVASLRQAITTAKAVGNLDSLATRLDALSATAKELTEKQRAEAAAAVAAALEERTALIVEAEKLAAQDPNTVQWKEHTTRFEALFARWQEHQHTGPRLPKKETTELWKRFRDARNTVDQNRRSYFATLDEKNREVRAVKERLIARAEALTSRGAAAIPDFRLLLEDWKNTGRASKKVDDALWERFKAAGDVLYAAKAEIDAKEDEQYHANLALKLALLTEAEALLTERDPRVARPALNRVQRQWDDIGKVPRDQVRTTDDRIRKVENHVKALEAERWERENPERKARSEGMLGQLRDAIAKLETELATAKSRGDSRAEAEAREALDARKAWLAALEK